MYILIDRINPLPNDKFLEWSKFKAFADDKVSVTLKQKFCLGVVENIVGEKEKMLVTSIFFFSHNVFKRLLAQSKRRDCVVKS